MVQGIPDMIGPLGEKVKSSGGTGIKNVANTSAQLEAFKEAGQSLIQGLFGLGGSGDTLSYPIDITGNPAYNASVKFEVYEYVPAASGQEQKSHIKQADDNSKISDLNEQYKVESNTEAEEQGEFLTGGDAAEDEKEKAKKAEASTVSKMFSSLTGGMDFFLKPGVPAIVMNFPPALSFVDGVQYDNAALGTTGATAMAMMEGGKGGLAAAGSALVGEAKSVVDAFNNDRTGSPAQVDALRLSIARAMEYIPGVLGGEKARNVMALNNRMIVNPNVRAVFRGVNIREFAFQFKLVATSPEEAQAVEKIIKHFRSELYPRAYPVSFGKAEADLGFYFPNAWKITFNFKGGRNMHIPKIKHCYMRTFNHTINPSGGGFRKDGQPNEIDISMSFVEHETLKQRDILEGF